MPDLIIQEHGPESEQDRRFLKVNLQDQELVPILVELINILEFRARVAADDD